MSRGPTSEILSDGRSDRRPSRAGPDAVREWWRRRSRVARAVVAALVGALLAGPVLAAVTLRVAPGATGAASLQVLAVPDAPVLAAEPWVPGPDGRPLGPPVLSVTAALLRDRSRPEVDVQVLGLTGTGVAHRDNPPVPLMPGSGRVDAPLRAVLDCEALSADRPPDGYALRIRSRSEGGGRRESVAPAGTVGDRWAAAAWTACASWTARRDLTVTAVAAHAHPTLPRIDLTLTLVNTGRRTMTVGTSSWPRDDLHVSGDLPAKVPAAATRTVAATLRLDRCDLATTLPGSGSLADAGPGGTWPGGPSGTTDLLGLAASAGSPTATARVATTAAAGYGEGLGPTGVVLTEDAGAAVASALRAACGAIGPAVALVAPGATRYDRVRHELSLPLLLDVTPGRVRELTLETSPPPAGDPGFVPLWTVTPALVPDRTGQVRVTLRYRAPAADPCPQQGPWLPGAVAVLRVPDAAGERVVRLSVQLDLTVDPTATRVLLCTPAGP